MNHCIERVTKENYPLFEDMIFWRENGSERKPVCQPVPERLQAELNNPNLFVYAAKVGERYVGWIALVYIPKVGKWNGHGHVYVDEIWVAPPFRGQGIAASLLAKADEWQRQLEAAGIRLYVNINNPVAQRRYEACGYREDGQAYFMEKCK